MPIHSLIIENFKSYLGTHRIGPFLTFQGIIGPNGSGKSNLMDAISFVLGVSTRVLRGGKLLDLICTNEDPSATSARSAYVELVYQSEKELKSSSSSSSLASGAEQKLTEIRFRRTISEKGVGGYRVDGKSVDKEDYEARLRSINVLVKARNFLVFQGDVENIASKAPQELTKLFEEISGSAELAAEYDELKEKHEEAERAHMAVFDKKRGAAKEKKQVKDQKEDAERYKKLLKIHKEKQTEFFLWQLFQAEAELDTHRTELQELRERADECKREMNDAESSLKKQGAEVATARREKAVADKDVAKQNKETEKLKPAQVKTKEQIAFIQKTIVAAETDLKKAETEYKKKAKELTALEKELSEVARERSAAEAKLASEAGKELKLAAEQLSEYNKLKIEAGSRTAPLRQQIEKLKREATAAKDRAVTLQSEVQTLNERKKHVQDEIAALNERREKMDRHIADTSKNLSDEQKKCNEIEEKAATSAQRHKTLSDQLVEVSNKLNEHSSEKRQSDKDRIRAEALETLQNLLPGVRGRLSQLCKPINAKYNIAVSIALGKMNDAIIVDDQKTCFECIKHFKDNRIGVETILPLDNIRVPSVNDGLRNLGGSVMLVLDVIQIEENLKKALLYVIGNTLICDTLDEARRLAYAPGNERKYKIVTLNGNVIHKTGNMTGGHTTDALKQAQVWDEKEVPKLRAMREKLFKEVVELEKSARPTEDVASMRVTIDGYKLRLKNSHADQTRTTTKLSQKTEELKAIDAQLARAEPDAANAAQTQKTKEAEVQDTLSSIVKEEDQVFAAFSKKVGVRSIREYEEKAKLEAEQLAEQQIELTNRESKLRSQLEYLKVHDWKAPIDKLKAKLENDQKSVATLQRELAALDERSDEQNKLLKVKEDALAKAEVRLNALVSAFNESRTKAGDLSKKFHSAEKIVIKKEGLIETALSLRSEVLRSAKMQAVVLPLADGGVFGSELPSSESDEKAPKRTAKKKVTPKKKGGKRKRGGDSEEDVDNDSDGEDGDEQLAKKRRTDGDSKDATKNDGAGDVAEGALDFSGLKHAKPITDPEELERKKAEYAADLADTVRQIEELAPNLKAAARFSEVQSRAAAAVSEWEEKKKEEKAAADKFDAIKTQRYKLFMNAFNHVATNIDPIYKNLTKGTTGVTGKAFLELESSDEPYLSGVKYTVMPPGKRFRDIEQLSGGEKTMAALSLLFAVHSYHPAPFFVMDEVDAALDNVNVDKVSNYIRQRTAEGLQCIVISLKETFYAKADGLVGIFRDPNRKSSAELSIDLRGFPTA